MIAPWREPETAAPPPRRLHEAREYLAKTLLEQPAEDRGPAVTPWKAWAVVGWMTLVVGIYAGCMMGWW
ncbi:MAG TPA: hypothetical protein VJL29_10625 [Thermoguttaceae bacterium]|nr:hypothetical protein [Thermoguttaceae bacterium]